MNLKSIKTKKNNSKKVYLSKRQGFSLVEVLVAMFVFVLVMTMLSGSFSGFLKNYANTKKSQKSVENAQFVMNQMEQVFLSSSHVSIYSDPDSNSVVDDYQLNFYNTMNSSCVVYYFDSSAKAILSDSTPAADPNLCVFPVPTEVLIGDSVVGFSAFGNQVKITLVFKIQELGQREATTIQSTALSRNAWINDPACPVTVLATDAVDASSNTTFEYKTTRTDCNTPQCGTDGAQDGDKLVADNAQDFAAYPARKQCQILGGRLPDSAELICLLTNKDIYGGSSSFTNNARYWTSEEVNTNKAYVIRNDAAPTSENTNQKNQNERVRCVK